MVNNQRKIQKQLDDIEELIIFSNQCLDGTESKYLRAEIEEEINRLTEEKAKLLIQLKNT